MPAALKSEVLSASSTTVALPEEDVTRAQEAESKSSPEEDIDTSKISEERQPQQRPAHIDLREGPPLDDTEFGEHAAAFLSGNFQPLIEETSASLFIGPEGELLSKDDDRRADGLSVTSHAGGNAMRLVGVLPADFPDGKFAYVGPNPKFKRDHYKVWGQGPGQADPGFGAGWHHWFEGDGMVYAMDFEDARMPARGRSDCGENTSDVGERVRRVRYRNRYVRTNSWHDELREGSRLFRPLMNAAGVSFLPNAVSNLFRGGNFLKDSANTALTAFAGRLLALQDTMPPWELDNSTLETKGSCDFDGRLPFYVPFTAHPKVSPGSGELVFFGFNPVYPPHCSVGSVTQEGILGPIKSLWHNAFQGATFMHDFCVTEKYTVLFEGSMNIRPLRMLKADHPLQYDSAQMARFGIIRRSTGEKVQTTLQASAAAKEEEVIWCDCGAAEMVYHFVNAWDDEATGEIVVIGVREDGFFHGALAANGTREWIKGTLAEGKAVPRMHEWRIDPLAGVVTSERWLFDHIVEVPRINDAFTGIKNRYAYAGRVHTESLADDAQLKFDAVVKFDMQSGTSQVYKHGQGRYGMEAQFVPRQSNSGGHVGATEAEDDGWLVMYVHDETSGKKKAAEGLSECVVLDARNIEAGPVTRIVLPSRVPYGAHAVWVPAEVAASEAETASRGKEQCVSEVIKMSPPEPQMFAFNEGQVGALLGTVRTGILRAAAGLFVNGWRPWVGADEVHEYAFIRAFGLRFKETRALGTVREAQAMEELAMPQAEDLAMPSLTLYEMEGCGSCRRVREALCMLDLAAVLKPCPHGAVRHRSAAFAAQFGTNAVDADTNCRFTHEDVKLPYLEDARTGVKLTGADDIITYLYKEYLDGSAPSPLVAPGPFAAMLAQVAVDARGSEDSSPMDAASNMRRGPAGAFYSRPSVAPDEPLVLWAYEASPFCAIVREALSELEIPYVMRPCSRGSPRRTQLMHRTGGTFQVPYLEDPNTGVAMFESADIVKYLRSMYLP